MMEDDEFVGCISCMGSNDLYDLFAVYEETAETYASLLETCFSIKVTSNLRHICADCADMLEKAAAFKDQTESSMAVLQNVKNEEYLDESILAEAEGVPDDPEQEQGVRKSGSDDEDEEFEALAFHESCSAYQLNEGIPAPPTSHHQEDIDDEHAIQALDETTCIYCDLQLSSVEEVHDHVRTVHELEPRTGQRLKECSLCGVALRDAADHLNRCHGVKSENEGRKYPCHFCDNVYISKKACFTHLRMKHGLKLCNDQTPKYVPRERKKCHLCNRDFSQKQILNKHLMKAHGLEVEKRKAFICPLCDERVSYGTHFSAHLLHVHRVHEHVEQLEFHHMDDFMLFKSAIQEETKYRFRKTTASKQTIEGIRSHYMCSQSGVYVYQGKGKRPAPERQIYKTGKACPAHMIVTETNDRVLVTFYKTHVGHGTCPYFEPREPKKPKLEYRQSASCDLADLADLVEQRPGDGEDAEDTEVLICDACGMLFAEIDKFRTHVATHGLELYPCQYCDADFQNLDSWSLHVRLEHNVDIVF